MATLRLRRHGGMPSSELEDLIVRNGNFLVVGSWGALGQPLEDGSSHVYSGITGESVCGLTSGWVPEFSRMRSLAYGCACNPTGTCRTGAHGTGLIRGWRNILHELLGRKRLHLTKEIRKVMGEEAALMAFDYGMSVHPSYDPHGVSPT